jgi:dTDP-4-dehydrorhamnose reductase
VDNAEKEEKLAFTVNAESPAILAGYSASRDIPFVNFSSDYVFDGSGDTPWREEDATSPLNAYGCSKLASENAVAVAGGKYLIFRTSWVYDAEGKNFLNTILRLAGERDELRIINDQFGAPTYAAHLAKAAISALEVALAKPVFPSGIYHLCNSGVTTWHGFASFIIAQARKNPVNAIKVKNIYPIPASEYPLPAKRPFNSRLDCTKVKSLLNVSMPTWEHGVEDCMKVKYENH